MSGSVSATTLAYVGLAASAAGAVTGAVGSAQSGNAAAAAANYNSEIQANNAKLATQQAQWAGQAGEAQAGAEAQKTKATVGAIQAAQAANGISVNSGSAVDVRSSASELGQLSAINIRSTAARQSYGLETQASSDTAQSQLDKFQGEQSQIAGDVGAGGDIISGAGSAASNYSKFLAQSSPLNANSISGGT